LSAMPEGEYTFILIILRNQMLVLFDSVGCIDDTSYHINLI